MTSHTSDLDMNDDESILQQVKQALLRVKNVATVSIESFDPLESYGAGFAPIDRLRSSGEKSWSSGLFGREKRSHSPSPSTHEDGAHDLYYDKVKILLSPGETVPQYTFRSVYGLAKQTASQSFPSQTRSRAFEAFKKKHVTVPIAGYFSVKARGRLAEELKHFAASLPEKHKWRKPLLELAVAITVTRFQSEIPDGPYVTPLLNKRLKELEIDLIDLSLPAPSLEKGPERRGRWLPIALALLKSQPDLLDCEIAKAVGVYPSTVSRSAQYRRAKELVVSGVQIASAISIAQEEGRRKAN